MPLVLLPEIAIPSADAMHLSQSVNEDRSLPESFRGGCSFGTGMSSSPDPQRLD